METTLAAPTTQHANEAPAMFGKCPACHSPAETVVYYDKAMYGVCATDEYYWLIGTGEYTDEDESVSTYNMLQAYKRVEGVL